MAVGARFLMLISLVVWVGGIMFFAVVVAPVLFSVLPTRELAGAVVTRCLTSLHWIGIVAGSVFLVAGHTDGKGGDEYNQGLSERRAEAIKRYLVRKFGLAAENLVTAGYGKTQLKNSGNPFADENRRVQVVNMRPPFRP